MAFPHSSVSKSSTCNSGDPGLSPGLGRSPGEGNHTPLQYSCLENPGDRGAWRATVHGVARVGHDLATQTNQLTILWWFLPYVIKNWPQVSPHPWSWPPLQSPSPPDPSELSQSNDFWCPASFTELALAIYFTCGSTRVSMLLSQITPIILEGWNFLKRPWMFKCKYPNYKLLYS